MKRSIATLGACIALLALSGTVLAAGRGRGTPPNPGQQRANKIVGPLEVHLGPPKTQWIPGQQSIFGPPNGKPPKPPKGPPKPPKGGPWPPKGPWGKHPGGPGHRPGHFDHGFDPNWNKYHYHPNWGPQWAPAPAPVVDVVIYNQTPMQIPVLFQGLSRVVPPNGSIQCELPNPENLAYQGGLGQGTLYETVYPGSYSFVLVDNVGLRLYRNQ